MRDGSDLGAWLAGVFLSCAWMACACAACACAAATCVCSAATCACPNAAFLYALLAFSAGSRAQKVLPEEFKHKCTSTAQAGEIEGEETVVRQQGPAGPRPSRAELIPHRVPPRPPSPPAAQCPQARALGRV